MRQCERGEEELEVRELEGMGKAWNRIELMRRGRVNRREKKIGINLWGEREKREDDWIYEDIEEEREIWNCEERKRQRVRDKK